ncbi:small integral membrane protein 26-like [Corythoichthys intestinalis]|uniref:small integral membrane protein 26-like n=1 Tax=Corythoichthys intestinalis TaxID=161448 RepID=UPI0025A53AFB|nr:small integral membrane protein 26-like [Corythoichthys intestinalis]
MKCAIEPPWIVYFRVRLTWRHPSRVRSSHHNSISFQNTAVSNAKMTLKNLIKWNKTASRVYALGVWTMIGSFAYFHFTSGQKSTDSAKSEERKKEERKNPNEVLYETEHTKTIIIYKKDFVPYTTRIQNFIQSFTGGPGTGDS